MSGGGSKLFLPKSCSWLSFWLNFFDLLLLINMLALKRQPIVLIFG